MDNLGNQLIKFMTRGFVLIFCICFGALVIFSGEPFNTMDQPQETASLESKQV